MAASPLLRASVVSIRYRCPSPLSWLHTTGRIPNQTPTSGPELTHLDLDLTHTAWTTNPPETSTATVRFSAYAFTRPNLYLKTRNPPETLPLPNGIRRRRRRRRHAPSEPRQRMPAASSSNAQLLTSLDSEGLVLRRFRRACSRSWFSAKSFSISTCDSMVEEDEAPPSPPLPQPPSPRPPLLCR